MHLWNEMDHTAIAVYQHKLDSLFDKEKRLS